MTTPRDILEETIRTTPAVIMIAMSPTVPDPKHRPLALTCCTV